MPKGLIPLMLSPSLTESYGSGSSRSSVILAGGQYINPSATSSASLAHRRNASDVTPMIKLSRPPVKTTKRHSQQVPASLPVLPFTSTEWRKAITEIKKCYITRRYRACSARCNEILTNTRDLVSCLVHCAPRLAFKLLTLHIVNDPAGLLDISQLLRRGIPRDVRPATATWVILQKQSSSAGPRPLQCRIVINSAGRGSSPLSVTIDVRCVIFTQPALSLRLSLISGVDTGVLPDDAQLVSLQEV